MATEMATKKAWSVWDAFCAEHAVREFLKGASMHEWESPVSVWHTQSPFMPPVRSKEYEEECDGAPAYVLVHPWVRADSQVEFYGWTDGEVEAFREQTGLACWLSKWKQAPHGLVIPMNEPNIARLTELLKSFLDSRTA